MVKYFIILTLVLSFLNLAHSYEPIKEVFTPSGSFPATEYVKVAVIQNRQKTGADLTNKEQVNSYKNENIKELDNYIRSAQSNGASLIVTPEYAIVGYPNTPGYQFKTREDVQYFVETVPGPITEHFSRLAIELKSYISINLLEEDEVTKKYFNTHVLISPDGKIMGKHRKFQLYKTEVDFLSAGEGETILNTPWGRVGLLVCADTYNILLLNKYYRKVEHLIVQASWASNTGWDFFKAASNLTNTNYIISNQHFFPDSGVINANGTEQSHIRQSEGIAYGYLKYKK